MIHVHAAAERNINSAVVRTHKKQLGDVVARTAFPFLYA